MSPLAVLTCTLRSGFPLAGGPDCSRLLRVVPAAVDRSSQTLVPAATPISTSPDAVLSRTSPRRTAPRRRSPEAVLTRTDASARSTTTSPLAVRTVASPPAYPTLTSPDAVSAATWPSTRSTRTSPLAACSRSQPAMCPSSMSAEAASRTQSPYRPVSRALAAAVFTFRRLSSGRRTSIRTRAVHRRRCASGDGGRDRAYQPGVDRDALGAGGPLYLDLERFGQAQRDPGLVAGIGGGRLRGGHGGRLGDRGHHEVGVPPAQAYLHGRAVQLAGDLGGRVAQRLQQAQSGGGVQGGGEDLGGTGDLGAARRRCRVQLPPEGVEIG